MYIVPPPKCSDARGSGNMAAPRIYQTWKGSNVFFLQGRFIFGPDYRSLLLTIFLIAAPVIVFCVFVARKLMDDFSHHLGISIMVIVVAYTVYVLSLLLLTSGRDPGIIPRNAHPPEPEGFDGSIEVGGGQTPQLRLPRMKDVVVNGISVKIKYCDTCMLYRPPRCSHCSICNNCVERFDHHCPWVGQCIGKRNYRFFFMFVFSTTLLCIYVFAFCCLYIKRIMDFENTSVWKALIKTPASIVLIIYTFISVWFVGGLTVFHLYLISTNQTTYENFRYRYDRRANPYNLGVVNNFKEIFFSEMTPSKNKFRARVPEEEGSTGLGLGQARVGPAGFVSPNMGRATVGGDLEMGAKASWRDMGGNMADFEGRLSSEPQEEKDGAEGLEGRGVMHPRRSSWGRKSGSWEISPEVLGMPGESERNSSSATQGTR
ncbi:probable protein S-acyltransferase 7 isoform X1 [Amborella trichopoda]|uniref:S-acyltransferase n=1 Tax=Amborella trichopoda TaxID=13333 RepID=W1PEX4_AMBTC|nr:probable protein S-acyltransferase 7 isoform X1 [Amborella trichopoda]ERN06254.1 hypothetical protein AMTR_s00016p00200180 [Amborella trichopoda]|eukprot:XP_006844579.1 probable protein S-acyltransferase 7 isoform X1 [Amborella trichopoda]